MSEWQIVKKATQRLAKAAFMWMKRGLADDWTELERATRAYDRATLKACREKKA